MLNALALLGGGTLGAIVVYFIAALFVKNENWDDPDRIAAKLADMEYVGRNKFWPDEV